MKNLSLLIVAFLLFCPALNAEERFPVGTKGRFHCTVDSNGFAVLWRKRRRTYSEVNMKAVLRRARRRRVELRLSMNNTTRELRRSLRLKRREWTEIQNGVNLCLASNNPIMACDLFTRQAEVTDAEKPTSDIVMPFIVDGSACNAQQSPVVRIEMFTARGYSQGICSGSLISKRTILSSAHCFTSGNAVTTALATVSAGDRTYQVRTIRVHPLYDGFSKAIEQHDLALLISDSDIDAPLMNIHFGNDLQRSELVGIAGYGLDEHAQTSGLRAGFMKLARISPESIAAIYLPGSGSNTCNGDSGGPLVVRRDDQWRIAGVTSNGDNWSCGRNGKEDISRWTNVTSASNLEFITNNAVFE